MYLSTDKLNFKNIFYEIGLAEKIKTYNDILIKINLARPPVKGHPRTDIKLLKQTLIYVLELGGKPTICESSDGFLEKNLFEVGILEFIKKNNINYFDIDTKKVFKVKQGDQIHYIPKIFTNFPIRIAIPCASKRDNSVFSNNIKIFMGAIPRRFYQKPELGSWRAKLHDNLHQSVKNVYFSINHNTPFKYYINGGNSYSEQKGEFYIDRIYIGNNALELDKAIIQEYFSDIIVPDYMKLVEEESQGYFD